ncbi:MAG: hypothetical protein M0P55_12020 [Clostridiales bacterium]|nr:hypothetical protein [Clostridiales bacterium]
MMVAIAAAFVFITMSSVFAAEETMGTIETMLAGDMTDVDPADDLMDPRDYNGALWDYFPSDQASGTGVFNTYLAIQPPGGDVVERGFNTGGKASDYNEADSKTSALPLTAVPLVEIDGIWYREFCTDINEVSGYDPTKDLYSQLLSLDVLQIWQSDSMNLSGTYDMAPDFDFTIAEPNLVYDLDGGYSSPDGDMPENNLTLILDYGINTGSGKPDYKVFIPDDWFLDKEYVVMVVVHGYLEEQYPVDYLVACNI